MNISFDIIIQLLANSLITGSMYALAAFGLALSYGIMRLLNFAHGHFLMVGAYLYYLASIEWGYNVFTSLLFSLLGISLVAILTLRTFIFPFLGESFVLIFVTTLSLGTIFESLISMIFGVNVKSLNQGSISESINVFGAYLTHFQIFTVATAITLLSLAAIFVHYTVIGRQLRGVIEGQHISESLGINSRGIYYLGFMLSIILTAIAGIMIGYETNVSPTMGGVYTIKAFAAMILGGLGNLWGTIVGSYILAGVENFAVGLDFGKWSIPAGYKDAFSFVVIILMLLFKPTGLFGKKIRTT